MKNNIDLTKSPKGAGFAGFLTWAIPAASLVIWVVGGLMLHPCQIAVADGTSGWSGCNNSAGDGVMMLFRLGVLGFTFLILPAAFIVGIIAVAQKADVKWGWLAMAPGILAVVTGGAFPFYLMHLIK